MFRVSRSEESDLYAVVPARLSLVAMPYCFVLPRPLSHFCRTAKRRVEFAIDERCRDAENRLLLHRFIWHTCNAVQPCAHFQLEFNARSTRPVFVCKTVFASTTDRRIGELIRSIIPALVSSASKEKQPKGHGKVSD